VKIMWEYIYKTFIESRKSRNEVDSLDNVINRWRKQRVKTIMRWGLFLTSPAIIFAGIYYIRLEEWAQLFLIVGAFLIFVIFSFISIPFEIHAATMVITSILFYYSTLSFVGVRGVAGTFLIASFLLAIMLLGSRAAVITMSITVSLMLIIGTGVVSEFITLRLLFDQRDPYIWILNGGIPIMMALVIGAGLKSIRNEIDAFHERERVAKAELYAERAILEDRVVERTLELQNSNQKLSQAYDTLKANQEKLLYSEKMATIGRLTAGIAHELNTPLAAIQASMYELEKLTTEYKVSIEDIQVTQENHYEIVDEMEQSIAISTRCSERCSNFVQSVKSQTQDYEKSSYKQFDVYQAIDDALQLLSQVQRREDCQTIFNPPTNKIVLYGSPESFTRVIINLVANAIDASKPKGGGEITIHLSTDEQNVLLQIRDDGIGIPDDVMPRVFEPMFTTKPFGEGSGLGLSTSELKFS
jgi:signal transduction histidine kinase